jgi:hypothetical protein
MAKCKAILDPFPSSRVKATGSVLPSLKQLFRWSSDLGCEALQPGCLPVLQKGHPGDFVPTGNTFTLCCHCPPGV